MLLKASFISVDSGGIGTIDRVQTKLIKSLKIHRSLTKSLKLFENFCLNFCPCVILINILSWTFWNFQFKILADLKLLFRLFRLGLTFWTFLKFFWSFGNVSLRRTVKKWQGKLSQIYSDVSHRIILFFIYLTWWLSVIRYDGVKFTLKVSSEWQISHCLSWTFV